MLAVIASWYGTIALEDFETGRAALINEWWLYHWRPFPEWWGRSA